MRGFPRCTRILILCLLGVFVFVVLLSHKLKHIKYDEPEEFIEDLSFIKHRAEAQTLNLIEQEESEGLKEPLLVVSKDETSDSTFGFSSTEDTNLSQNNATRYHKNEHDPNTKPDDKLLVSGAKEERSFSHTLNEMKDQITRARAYLNLSPENSNSHFVKELKLRMKDLGQAMSQSTRDSRLSRSALQKMKAMESTLLKASRIYPDCSAMVKKLRAMTNNAEEQVKRHRKQEKILKELGGRTIPKSFHCLSMKLTAEYFALDPEKREFHDKNKLHNLDLYHFAVFSDNVLACSVVVNSTISTAKDPEKIVFHIVTNSLNFPAMSMWFLLNPPQKATIQVESIENFRYFSSKRDLTLPKEVSVDQRYTSELNHLRFYLPHIFPHLDKIVLFDHDVVAKRDLTKLWTVNLRGKVNGAVETCTEGEISYRRMDMFLNFSEPIIANRFDDMACTWAFGMNIFDLREWRRRNLTEVYNKYLDLGNKLPLFKAGSLPIGWITFYEHTYPLDKRWHVLGLGYESGVNEDDIKHAAVVHFDGILKPWLDIGVENYKQLWRRHVDYEHPYLQQCNIHE